MAEEKLDLGADEADDCSPANMAAPFVEFDLAFKAMDGKSAMPGGRIRRRPAFPSIA